jgi:HlyD family secretion protein
MRITRRRTVMIVAGALALGGVAWAMRPDPVTVETVVAARGPLRVTVDAEGRTQVLDRYVVVTPVAGRVRRIALEEGEAVVPGQVVAVVAPLPLDAQSREQAEARLRSARALQLEARARVDQAREAEVLDRRSRERREALYAAGAVSAEERDRVVQAHASRLDDLKASEARLSAATADVAAVRALLLSVGEGGLVEVRSPCRGRVLRVTERSERVVPAGAPLLELGDARALEVVADVLSSDAIALRPGQLVEIAEWGGTGPLHGSVRTIEPSAFTRVSALGVDEQRVKVRIAIERAPATLGDNFRVETRTTVWEGANVLTVPSSAVFQTGEGWRLFVVRDGRARLRAVQAGRHDAAATEITAGIAEGDRVVLFPSDDVRDGVRVRLREP